MLRLSALCTARAVVPKAAAILSCLAVLLLCGIAGLCLHIAWGLPSIASLKTTEGLRSLAVSGALHLPEDRLDRIILIPPGSVPAYVEKAVITVSDGPKGFGAKLFYPSGTVLAFDLAKLLLAAEAAPGYDRAARQAVLQLKIEYSMSREEMISAWLSTSYFGKGTYGATAAAALYFNKTIAELDLCEAALLAALPYAPSSDNPITGPDRARKRRQKTVNDMVKLGLASVADLASCK